MGNVIGILSTVILVSTVCTLIFAVGAYVVSRKNRDGVGEMNEVEGGASEDIADQFPHADPAAQSALFKRVHPQANTDGSALSESTNDDEYAWK